MSHNSLWIWSQSSRNVRNTLSKSYVSLWTLDTDAVLYKISLFEQNCILNLLLQEIHQIFKTNTNGFCSTELSFSVIYFFSTVSVSAFDAKNLEFLSLNIQSVLNSNFKNFGMQSSVQNKKSPYKHMSESPWLLMYLMENLLGLRIK